MQLESIIEAICYIVKLLKQEIALLNKSCVFQRLEMSMCVCVEWGGECDGAELFWCWNKEEGDSKFFQHSDNQTLAH